jgi:hypothetical protein
MLQDQATLERLRSLEYLHSSGLRDETNEVEARVDGTHQFVAGGMIVNGTEISGSGDARAAPKFRVPSLEWSPG